MQRTDSILHVDMDAFYASVEVLLDPSLAGKPVIVGGLGERGVVAACTYEARAFGVHSAMPSARARRLCPSAVWIPGHYDRYSEFSGRIHEIFRRFTPLVEGIALDEAFLDVGGAVRLFGGGPAIAWSIRRTIADELRLSASVGVATSKFLAKLASEAAKPIASRSGTVAGAGVVVVPPGEELPFLHPLPVRALWGVGPKTFDKLAALGVVSVGDLSALPVTTLVSALGQAVGTQLHQLAWARDDRAVEPDRAVKSVSHEETYARDLFNAADLQREVVRLADGVGGRLRAAGLAGRTVTIKVRFHDFATVSRSRTVADAVDSGPVIASVASGLLDAVDPSPGVRLLGVGVTNLTHGSAHQLSLGLDGGAAAAPWEEASAAVDEIRRRFGDHAVGPAALIDDGDLRVKRRGDTQWGPDRG